MVWIIILGNLSILAHPVSSWGQSDNSLLVFMYSQPGKYIHHATSKPIIILYHKSYGINSSSCPDTVRMTFALWVRPHTEGGTSCIPEQYTQTTSAQRACTPCAGVVRRSAVSRVVHVDCEQACLCNCSSFTSRDSSFLFLAFLWASACHFSCFLSCCSCMEASKFSTTFLEGVLLVFSDRFTPAHLIIQDI